MRILEAGAVTAAATAIAADGDAGSAAAITTSADTHAQASGKVAQAKRRDALAGQWPLRALLVVLALHLIMGLYDSAHPEVWLNADRAVTRWQDVQAFIAAWDAGGVLHFLAVSGNPGDYLIHAVLYLIGGKGAVIAGQVALALASGLAVFRLGRLLGLSPRVSEWTTAVYLLLPHSLVFPHQLSTEAWHTPLVVISTWGFIAALGRQDSRGLSVASGLLQGLAILVRPVTLLLPLLLLGLGWRQLRGRRLAALYLAGAFLPVLAWFAFVASQGGGFGFGPSSRDLGHNLYARVLRISHTLPEAEAAQVQRTYLNGPVRKVLPLGDYVDFAATYPAAVLKHSARDTVMFVVKSGLERIPIDYLEVNRESRAELQDDRSGWRFVMETQGVGQALGYLWRSQGPVLATSLVGAVLMLLLFGLALLGSVIGLRGWHGHGPVSRQQGQGLSRLTAAMLVAVVLYILLLSQAVDAVQSRHRAPAEFALVLLAASGATWLARRRLRITTMPTMVRGEG